MVMLWNHAAFVTGPRVRARRRKNFVSQLLIQVYPLVDAVFNVYIQFHKMVFSETLKLGQAEGKRS